MKKIIIVLPLYNDWKSANKLLGNINKIFLKKSNINIIIVDDYSSEKINIDIKKYLNIKKIHVLSLNQNVGSQKAIYLALKKIQNETNAIIVVMDADGEDDPSKLRKLVIKAEKNEKGIVFAKRTKRTENVILRFLNIIRLIITFLLTGKFLNIGNFCAFSGKNLKALLSNRNITLAFSSGAIKNIKKNYFISIKKKNRYFGRSKVSFYFLIMHSINLISVFYKEVFLRTSVVILLYLIIKGPDNNIAIIFSFYTIINLCLILNYFINTNNIFNKKITTTTKRFF